MLTLAQIHAAQDNDLRALTAVITDMDERVARLAAQASRRLDGDHREDFEQDAREALFMALPRFSGESVDAFYAYMYSSMQDALKDKVRGARYQGVDKDAVKVFMSVMPQAEGDPYRAEALAQTLPAKGLRLSADRAQAARLAWQGASSIDKSSDDTAAIADMLAAPEGEPLEIRPKVGHGAALEALRVLERYAGVTVQRTTPRMFAANLPTLVAQLEDSVIVPRETGARRAVLDAMAILRSAVSTTTDGELAADLRDESDDNRDQRAAKIANVREALSRMAAQQRTILEHSFGINGAQDFGWGDGCDVEGLMALLGTSSANLRKQRSVGKSAFAKHYIALAARTLDEAEALTTAAAEMRKPGGRK
ncbi:hypothetical protein ACIGPN_06030 [Streptomyces afghaniensis]|uniref:hypothetical protein n=1 Tax=Streptomyces afghaniensis TaxID=66865 RepID=UPI0037D2FEB3